MDIYNAAKFRRFPPPERWRHFWAYTTDRECWLALMQFAPGQWMHVIFEMGVYVDNQT